MFKYLITEVEEHGDDFVETPVRCANNYTLKETDGCNVYEILADGTIDKIIKHYETYSDEGFKLVRIPYDCGEDEKDKWEILDSFSCKNRKEFLKSSKCKEWYVYFKEETSEKSYRQEIDGCGSIANEDDNMIAIVEYQGNFMFTPW